MARPMGTSRRPSSRAAVRLQTVEMIVDSVRPKVLMSCGRTGAWRRQATSRSGRARSPAMITKRSDGGSVDLWVPSSSSRAVMSCQYAVGRLSMVIDRARQVSRKVGTDSSMASLRSTSSPPSARHGTISSRLMSKLIEQNWRMRSAGPNPYAREAVSV
jgi:hypothetical protein